VKDSKEDRVLTAERKDHYVKNAKSRRLLLKMETLKRYGGCCQHCGFDDFRALQLDHINDNGAEERRNLPGGGWQFYHFLKKNGFPEGYQTLCANCNTIKEWERRQKVHQDRYKK
jgi:hypothetical protein